MAKEHADLRAADIITIVFSAFLAGLALVFHDRISSAPILVLIYASVILFQILLLRLCSLNVFFEYTRDLVFPVIAVLIIFDSLGLIVHAVNPVDIDHVLIQIDYLAFGGYPTVMIEPYMQPLLTDVLQIAYATYYFMPVAIGILLKVRGRQEEFERVLFLILFCFYFSYVGYILFPALGPRYVMPHLHGVEISGFLVTEQVQNILNLLEGVKRDAFPSGHTAIALLVLVLSRRYEKVLFLILLLPVALLVIGTVYLRYHYVVDVVAGVALLGLTLTAGEGFYNAWIKRKRPNWGNSHRSESDPKGVEKSD